MEDLTQLPSRLHSLTLENREERILGNMIICLPNQVTLQLFTPEELLEMMKGQQ